MHETESFRLENRYLCALFFPTVQEKKKRKKLEKCSFEEHLHIYITGPIFGKLVCFKT